MNRRQTRSLARPVKPSQLVVAQRQIAVSPFDIGTRTLKHLCELFGLLSEGTLGLGTQRTQGAIRLKQGRAKAVSELPKRLSITDGESLGHTIEIIRWNKSGMHGEGCWRCQVQLSDLLPHVT